MLWFSSNDFLSGQGYFQLKITFEVILFAPKTIQKNFNAQTWVSTLRRIRKRTATQGNRQKLKICRPVLLNSRARSSGRGLVSPTCDSEVQSTTWDRSEFWLVIRSAVQNLDPIYCGLCLMDVGSQSFAGELPPNEQPSAPSGGYTLLAGNTRTFCFKMPDRLPTYLKIRRIVKIVIIFHCSNLPRKLFLDLQPVSVENFSDGGRLREIL